MVWPFIMGVARTYAPYITFPVALVVGFIGYNIEGWVRGDKNTPFKEAAVLEERSERRLEQIQDRDCTQVESLKAKTFVPKSILGRNDLLK